MSPRKKSKAGGGGGASPEAQALLWEIGLADSVTQPVDDIGKAMDGLARTMDKRSGGMGKVLTKFSLGLTRIGKVGKSAFSASGGALKSFFAVLKSGAERSMGILDKLARKIRGIGKSKPGPGRAPDETGGGDEGPGGRAGSGKVRGFVSSKLGMGEISRAAGMGALAGLTVGGSLIYMFEKAKEFRKFYQSLHVDAELTKQEFQAAARVIDESFNTGLSTSIEETKEVVDRAIEWGAITGRGADSLADAVDYTKGLVKQSLIWARATGTAVGEAFDLTTQWDYMYGLGMKSIPLIQSGMRKIAALTGVSVKELASMTKGLENVILRMKTLMGITEKDRKSWGTEGGLLGKGDKFLLEMTAAGAAFAKVGVESSKTLEIYKDFFETRGSQGLSRLAILTGKAAEELYKLPTQAGGMAEFYDLFVEGATKAVAAAKSLSGTDTGKFAEALKQQADLLGTDVETLIALADKGTDIKGVMREVKEKLEKEISTGALTMEDVAKGIMDPTERSMARLGFKFKKLMGVMGEPIFDALTDLLGFTEELEAAKTPQERWKVFKGGFSELWEKKIKPGLSGIFEAAWEGLKSAVVGIGKIIAKSFSGLYDLLIEFADKLPWSIKLTKPSDAELAVAGSGAPKSSVDYVAGKTQRMRAYEESVRAQGGRGRFEGPALDEILNKVEEEHGISAAAMKAMLRLESGLQPDAVSPAGAKGIAQFMPGTGKQYGLLSDADLFNPEKAIPAAALLLKDIAKETGLNLNDPNESALAWAGYNAGTGWWKRKGRTGADTIRWARDEMRETGKSLVEYLEENPRAFYKETTEGMLRLAASPEYLELVEEMRKVVQANEALLRAFGVSLKLGGETNSHLNQIAGLTEEQIRIMREGGVVPLSDPVSGE